MNANLFTLSNGEVRVYLNNICSAQAPGMKVYAVDDGSDDAKIVIEGAPTKKAEQMIRTTLTGIVGSWAAFSAYAALVPSAATPSHTRPAGAYGSTGGRWEDETN